MDKEKAIVVLSGGMDSVTLLHEVVAQGYQPYGISFYYGQRHQKELEFARYWGEKLCREWKKIDITFLQSIAVGSALVDEKIDMPHEHYTHENQKVTVVPNRNMIMLSIAAAWAENIEGHRVFFGPHANDYAIYPDCRPQFVDAVSKASALGTYQKVEIVAPFVQMKKHEIAKRGHELAVDFRQTWSCYEGREKHCGLCATCQERKEVFTEAGIADPSEYQN